LVNSNYYQEQKPIDTVDERIIKHHLLAIQHKFYEPTGKYDIRKKKDVASYQETMIDFIDEFGLEYIKYIPYLKKDKINSDDLFEVLNKHISVLEGNNENLKSVFYKMICYYDFLKYHLGK